MFIRDLLECLGLIILYSLVTSDVLLELCYDSFELLDLVLELHLPSEPFLVLQLRS